MYCRSALLAMAVLVASLRRARTFHLVSSASSRSVRCSGGGGGDNWERWEFGEESFIDAALSDAARAEATDAPPAPVLGGAVAYDEGIQVLTKFVSEERLEKMTKAVDQRSGRARFVIEDPVNPSNAWACLRTLDSFGVQYVDVITNPENYRDNAENQRYRRVKTAMGTQKWLDVGKHESAANCIQDLKADGWRILATDLSPTARPIDEVEWSSFDKYAVVLGNEERGISQEMRDLADECFYVPMRGFAQSFSLSVSCAVLSAHLNCLGSLHPGSLAAEDRARVLFSWMLDSVKGGREILRREGFDIPKHRPPRTTILNFKL